MIWLKTQDWKVFQSHSIVCIVCKINNFYSFMTDNCLKIVLKVVPCPWNFPQNCPWNFLQNCLWNCHRNCLEVTQNEMKRWLFSKFQRRTTDDSVMTNGRQTTKLRAYASARSNLWLNNIHLIRRLRDFEVINLRIYSIKTKLTHSCTQSIIMHLLCLGFLWIRREVFNCNKNN